MGPVPTEGAASSCPEKAPLEEACQKLWKNLKILPKTGKRVQQQLKSHLATVSSSLLRDSKQSEGTHDSATGADDAVWDSNIYTDPFVATSLASPSKPQALKVRDDSSRKALRSVSWSEVTLRTKDWHQAVVRALSSQVSKLELRDLEEPQEDWLPEEYRPPPPFAPGYC